MSASISRLTAAVVATWLLVLAPSGCRPPPPRPNVILISIDCMNARQLDESTSGGYAPNLAELARQSLVFTRAYAQAPWTTPSHMSMLTGLYPSEHGRDVPFPLMFYNGSMDERIAAYETMADRLTADGYESVAFVGQGSISARFGLGQGFASYHESSKKNPDQSDLVASEAGLRSWLANRAPRPFFLFFHTYDIHFPLPKNRRQDADAIRYVDEFLGRLFSLLRERGAYDSSLIIVTGDHGSNMLRMSERCCSHGIGHYEENLKVPLILKLPAPAPAGPKHHLVRHIDLLPTVLDVVGLPRGSYAGAGVSILERLGSEGDDVVSFSEADARCLSRRAVVTRRYKYIYTPQDPWYFTLHWGGGCERFPACAKAALEELYDLETDPLEERDLLKGDLAPEAALALNTLRESMNRHLNLPRQYRLSTLTSRPAAGKTPAELDESTKEALRALGYTQ